MTPALFLDRDGVINVDRGYVHRAEDTEFVDGIFDLAGTANQIGYQVIVVTNQAGIARGYYSEAQFIAYSDWMRCEFEARGARIDAIYYCPHHPIYGIGRYMRICDCRKPAPGMLTRAALEHDINLEGSVMIGDRMIDMAAAKAAHVGLRLLLSTEENSNSDDDGNLEIIQTLDDAKKYI